MLLAHQALTVVMVLSAFAAGCGPTAPPAPAPTSAAPTALAAVSDARDRALPRPRAIAAAARSDPPPLAPLSREEVTALERAVERPIAAGELPGAVVVLVREGDVVFRRAFGRREVDGDAPMTEDTVFDLASLTKPMATALAVMALVDDGRLTLDDPVARYLSGCALGPDVTVGALLRHETGLPAVDSLADYTGDRDRDLARIRAIAPRRAASTYSDLGYIVLGDLVEHVSGVRLDELTRERLYRPLGLVDTTFTPPDTLRRRTAPTVRVAGGWRRGEVHDPRAERLHGVAGHAGLFSTADDLTELVRVLLSRGQRTPGALSAAAAQALLGVPPEHDRTAAFARMYGGLGHTGFTGTFVWLDPASSSAAVVLTSRLQLGPDASVTALRRDVVGVLRHAMARRADRGRVEPGIDVLAAAHFEAVAGLTVGVVTHDAARTDAGERTLDVLVRAPEVQVARVFSPEHGLSGTGEGARADTLDVATGLPVHSLYGRTRRPAPALLDGLDAMVVDLQDAGTRFYTYATTLGYVLEAAAARGLPVVVLDRPNPIGGTITEGPVLDERALSFTGYHPLPVRHGMTMGELALMFEDERNLRGEVRVVRMRGWRREDLWEDTRLTWWPPSPNLRTPTEALLYPGVGLLEATNLSVGRGTERPFEQLGAPFVDATSLAVALDAARLGAHFTPTTFRPSASTFRGVDVHGVTIDVNDPHRLRSVSLGMTIARELSRHAPGWDARGLAVLLRDPDTEAALARGDDPRDIVRGWASDLASFEARRRRYALY